MGPESISMLNTAHHTNELNDNITPPAKKLPGDMAMWFFILAELTVFGIFFIAFAVTEQLYQPLFSEGKQLLHPIAGLINTLALITSSYFVVLALQAFTSQKYKQTSQLLICAQAMACLYLGVKYWEYSQLFALDIGIETNTFFTLYFLITAFHFLHVLLGMAILALMTIRAQKVEFQQSISGFEAGASYWHMVDLVWIILFPLIYVI